MGKLKKGVDYSNSVNTVAGSIVGTPAYMSPEQASGRSADLRADLYSLGVLLYEAVTGDLPFQGNSFGDYLLAHMTAKAVRPSTRVEGLPPGLDEIILDCMEKEPERRPASEAFVGDKIRAALDGDGKREFREVDRKDGAGSSARGLAIAAVVVALAGGGLGVFFAGAASDPKPQPLDPEPAVVVEPSTVRIRVHSQPPGALVTPSGAGAEAWGVTPLLRQIEPSSEVVEVKVSLLGHITQALPITLSETGTFSVVLPAEAKVVTEPKPVRRRGRRRPGRRSSPTTDGNGQDRAPPKNPDTKPAPEVKRDAIMNPFE